MARRTHEYTWKNRAKTVTYLVVYCDGSVEMGLRYVWPAAVMTDRQDVIEDHPRHDKYQTREEAAWTLENARSSGREIEMRYL